MALIKKFIVDKIRSELWLKNHQAPFKNELGNQFNTSRMTARHALGELTAAGVLSRSQGLGAFVANFKSQSSLLEIKNFADEIKLRNSHYSCHEAIPAAVSSALGMSVNSTVYHSVIVHNENHSPLQVEERFVNPNFATRYLKPGVTLLTPHEYLTRVAPLTPALHTVEAIMPNQDICQWLKLSAQEPCQQLIRCTCSSKGIVSFARRVSPGSKYRLGGHLTFTS